MGTVTMVPLQNCPERRTLTKKKILQSASFLSLPVPWLQVFCSQASSLHWRGDLGHRGWTNSHCKQPSPDFYQMQKREASTGVTITSNRKKILTWTNSRPSGPPWLYTIPAMTTGQMPGKSGDIYRGKQGTCINASNMVWAAIVNQCMYI